MEMKIKQCVNSEFLEVIFKDVLENDFGVNFFEKKLKPLFLKVKEIKSFSSSSDYGNIFAKAKIELVSREETESVIAQLRYLKPQFEKVFDLKIVDISYKEISPADYL